MKFGKNSIAIAVSFMLVLFLQSCSYEMLGLSSPHSHNSTELADASDIDFHYDSHSREAAGYRAVHNQNPSNYTIQLASGKKANTIEQAVNSAHLDCNVIHYYIKSGKNVKHAVACGSFSSLAEANSFRSTLPKSVNTSAAGIYQWGTLQKLTVPY